jgi:hypothetical protein
MQSVRSASIRTSWQLREAALYVASADFTSWCNQNKSGIEPTGIFALDAAANLSGSNFSEQLELFASVNPRAPVCLDKTVFHP